MGVTPERPSPLMWDEKTIVRLDDNQTFEITEPTSPPRWTCIYCKALCLVANDKCVNCGAIRRSVDK